jgi:oxygen-dependent protoporphyrinogen oxidase
LELLFGSNGLVKFALLSDLLSWAGKIRAGVGAFIGHAPPPSLSSSSSSTGGGDGGTKDEETIKQWVIRILGTEVYYRIIDPFISGIYAGDPTTLSMACALPKICNIETMSYNISWNKYGGALFYGGLARQIELTKERKAHPPDPTWVDFEYGNPGSYRNGLSTLPLAIQGKLGNRVRLGWTLIDIVKKKKQHTSSSSGDDGIGGNDDDDYYIATFEESSTGTKHMINTRSVVSTIPAHAIGTTLNNVLPGSAPLFTKYRDSIQRTGIYYPPVAAVTLAYPKTSFRDVELTNGFGKLYNLPGFGLLNPRSEGIRTLGSLWTSSLFPNRCPPEYNILLNYIGGSRDPAIGTMSNEDIVSAVVDDLHKTLLDPSNTVPPIVLGVKLWPTAIPQYELGHATIMNELKVLENNNVNGGIWVCGNYRTGVAFPDCVTFGYEHAKIVAEYLNNTKKKESGTTKAAAEATTTTTTIRTKAINDTKNDLKVPYFLTLV